jgi:hypothetical protein
MIKLELYSSRCFILPVEVGIPISVCRVKVVGIVIDKYIVANMIDSKSDKGV